MLGFIWWLCHYGVHLGKGQPKLYWFSCYIGIGKWHKNAHFYYPTQSQHIHEYMSQFRVNPTEIYDDPWNPRILTMLTCCIIIIIFIILLLFSTIFSIIIITIISTKDTWSLSPRSGAKSTCIYTCSVIIISAQVVH